ncbi:hypothetical protein [Bacillus infantis]
MKDEKKLMSEEELDALHHVMEEQIAYILVDEEEERSREEHKAEG